MVNSINLIIEMSPHFILGRENVPCVAEVVNRSLKADCTDYTFTKLWQSCRDPHLKIRPIAIFAFYFLNYSLAAHLQDNSRSKSPTKVEEKRKLQQFTVSGWLIMNGGES